MTRLEHALRLRVAELERDNAELRRARLEHEDTAALQDSRDRYRDLYDRAPFAYVTMDADGRIIEANSTAAELLGVRLERLEGRHLAAFTDEADGDALHRHRRTVLQGGSPAPCRVRLLCADGRRLFVRVKSRVVAGARGAAFCRSVFFDEAELRGQEERLRDTEARFHEVAVHLHDAFYIVERDNRVSYVSPAYDQIWGRSADALVDGSRRWPDEVDRRDRDRVWRALARLAAGADFDETYRIRRADGAERWIRDRAWVVRDGGGTIMRFVGVARDITDERAVEQQLHQTAKMEAVGTLAAGIAHDFRNLLHGIAGCVQVSLRRSDLPDPARVMLASIGEAVRRGTALTDPLMTFSHRQDVQFRPVVVDGVVADATLLILRLVGEQIEVRVRKRAPGAAVLGDPVQIEQLLLNLAANAADAMPYGGTLLIETDEIVRDLASVRAHGLPAGTYVRLRVSDTGVGMDEATRRRIFEPFFTTKGLGRGTGLGLSTAFAIAERMQGALEVESELGRGSTFTLLLPRSFDAIEEKSVEHGDVGPLRGTVLLVEDDPLVRLATLHYLHGLGLEVLEASSPQMALELCASHPRNIDALVSDVMMPGMVGPRLATELRGRYPDLPVLYVSAHSAEELVRRGTLQPGDFVLRKPFDRSALGRRLATLLPAAHMTAPSATVLLVDDDDLGRETTQMMLEHDGFRVLACARPSDALVTASKASIDVLVTDLNLPEMSGFELARALSDLPAIFLSGRSVAPSEGSGEHLTKPVDFAELGRAVTRAVARRNPHVAGAPTGIGNKRP